MIPEELLASARYAVGEVVPLPPRQPSTSTQTNKIQNPDLRILHLEDNPMDANWCG